jgi:hypothetical protein
MLIRSRLHRLALCFALLPATLSAQELSGSARLIAPESSVVILNAVVTLPVDSLPTAPGEPVRKGAILVEMKVEKLDRELSARQKYLRAIQEEKRFLASNKQGARGGGTPLFSGPDNSQEAVLAMKEVDAMRDLLEVQTRLSTASPRAPADGYLIRAFVAVGADAKRRKPLVSFVPADKTSLAVTLPEGTPADFPPGTNVTVRSPEDDRLSLRGVVTGTTGSAAGGLELTIRPLELPFLALDRPQAVTVTVAR